MDYGSVSERIAQMVDYFHKGNKSAFAKAVGISNQSLGEIVGTRQSAPSFAALQKMLIAFPTVRMEWLIMGKGKMLQAADKKEANPVEYVTKEQHDALLDKVSVLETAATLLIQNLRPDSAGDLKQITSNFLKVSGVDTTLNNNGLLPPADQNAQW